MHSNLTCTLGRLRLPALRSISYKIDTDSFEGIVESPPSEQGVKILLAYHKELHRLNQEKDKLVQEKDKLTWELVQEKDKVAQKDKLTRKLLQEKDKLVSLTSTLSRSQHILAEVMYSAGVTSGRSMLDFVQIRKGDGGEKKAAWKHILQANDKLLECILKDIPEWARAVNRKTKEEQQNIIASRIAAVHGELSNHVHSFLPDAGLIIFRGVPNMAVTTVLHCIAKHNGIPVQIVDLQKAPWAATLSGGSMG